MRTAMGVPTGVILTLAILAACSKPASETTAETADAAGAAATDASMATADAAGGMTQPGGAVSPPASPQNDAVNTDANTGDAATAAASNSFTEGQARGHIENAGYTAVTGLTKTPEGLWKAKAMKDGKSMDVSLDFKGAVTSK